MVATEEELRVYSNHASQMAALDYIISLESDVFIPTHSGNMARAVEGHRRFLGLRKKISPDMYFFNVGQNVSGWFAHSNTFGHIIFNFI